MGQIPGESSQETDFSGGFPYNQHTKHFPFFQFFLPVVPCFQIGLYLFCRQKTKRMRGIMERISERFRLFDTVGRGLKGVKFAYRHNRSH